MSDFLWFIAFLVFCFIVLVIGFFLLAYIISIVSTVIKHKPKSYAEYKRVRDKDLALAKENSDKISGYKQQVMALCDKALVSDDDISQLSNYVSENKLSDKQIKPYAHKAFKKHYAIVMKDDLLTDEEVASLDRVYRFLQPEQVMVQKELNEIARRINLREIQLGKLPQTPTSTIVLKKNEIAHFVVGANLLEERVVSRSYKGGSHGVSFRIAKGLTYRVGQSRGKLVSEKGIVTVDSGDFIITNQRLIFSGGKKSFSYEYRRLLAWNMYSDGILLNIDNASSRTLTFVGDVDIDAIHFALSFLVKNYDF